MVSTSIYYGKTRYTFLPLDSDVSSMCEDSVEYSPLPECKYFNFLFMSSTSFCIRIKFSYSFEKSCFSHKLFVTLSSVADRVKREDLE